MEITHLVVIGLGRLGRACAEAIMQDEKFVLAGVVRGPEQVTAPLPEPLKNVLVVSHVSELKRVDAALVCVPTEYVLGVAQQLLQHRIPVVECATLHGDAFQEHKEALDKIARHHKVAAIVGAGWDPGGLSLFRELFALFLPHGHTEISRNPGISLHHTTIASSVPGVREALATELQSNLGIKQHYIYVELEKGVEFESVEEAIRSDPLFIGEETLIFPVEDIASLEEQGHGIVMKRRGAALGKGHQFLLLEARFSELALSANMMLTAARALPGTMHRAYSLSDLPSAVLWGELRQQAEKEWL